MMRSKIVLLAPVLAGVLVFGLVRRGPAPEISEDPAAARRERGRYLVEGPAHCFMCHSELDWSKEGYPPRPGGEGAGQNPFPEEIFPWLVAPNITPDPETGTGRWTDDQFRRALRQGIGSDGRTLFPMMPYAKFHGMSDEDVESVIAYLRSIPPVRREVPRSRLPGPVRAALRPLPSPGRVPEPDRSTPEKYGEYLVRISNCTACHTPVDAAGAPLAGMDWAGGLFLAGPWGSAHSVNLTPDPSGIPYYTEEHFLRVMRTGDVGGRKLNSIMPWGYFGKMTDEDLKAIYAYLKTLRPVSHRIDNTSPKKPCAKCGGVHGLGEFNR